jgi:hypothetical protein
MILGGISGAMFYYTYVKKGGDGGVDFTPNSRSTSKLGLVSNANNNSTMMNEIPGLMDSVDNGFKKQMTKQELIEKERKEMEAIKKMLQEQGMDAEEIQRQLGDKVNHDDIEVSMKKEEGFEMLEVEMGMSMRTENRTIKTALENGTQASSSAKTDDILVSRSQMQRMSRV